MYYLAIRNHKMEKLDKTKTKMDIKPNQQHHFHSLGMYTDDEGEDHETCIDIGMSDKDIELFSKMIKEWVRQERFIAHVHDSDPLPWMVEIVMKKLNSECNLESVLCIVDDNDVETVKDIISELSGN